MTEARCETSDRARARIDRALEWLGRLGASERAVVVGPSRAALAELSIAEARARGARFGLECETLTSLAARLAFPLLAARGKVAARSEVLERVTLEALRSVRSEEGWTAQLGVAREIEAWLARGDDPNARSGSERVRRELEGWLAQAIEARRELLDEARLADRAEVLLVAEEAVRSGAWHPAPLLAIDVPVGTRAEARLLGALVARAPSSLVLAPSSDRTAIGWLRQEGLSISTLPASEQCVQHGQGGQDEQDEPSETRVLVRVARHELGEAEEVARTLLAEAHEGGRFEHMAIVVRRAEPYVRALAEVLERAQIPAYFEAELRPTSADAQALVDLLGARVATDRPERLVAAYERRAARSGDVDPSASLPEGFAEALGTAAPQGSIATHAAVRCEAIARRLELELEGARLGEAGSLGPVQVARACSALRDFAAEMRPILEALDAIEPEASWERQLDAVAGVARAAGLYTSSIEAALDELGPLGERPRSASADEVVSVITARLSAIREEAATSPSGAVLVTGPDGLRGRARSFVAIVGLGEGMFPARGGMPSFVEGGLGATDAATDALDEEREKFEIARGAAEEFVVFTVPREELATGRERAPSVFVRPWLRTPSLQEPPGERPSTHGEHERTRDDSSQEGEPRSVTVLDPLEWERAFVRSLGALPLERSAGAARWLLDPAGSSRAVWLRTALSRRRSRSDGRPAGPHDGLWARTDRARRELGRRGLLGRAFTASALEQYARCPYRFFLRAFVGLAPRARALPTSTLAPGAYAALVHRAVFELVGQLREHGVRLDDRDNFRPVEELARSCCRRVVEAALGELVISSDDRRSPMADQGAGASLAAELEADVLGWVRDRSMLRDGFTSIEAGRALGGVGIPSTNPSRSPRIEGRFAIAGIIDLVERHEGGLVRVTDLRADSPPQSHDSARLVAGGERLAPALHLLAMEDSGELGASEAVVEHRTVHATRAGSYARRTLERDERTRPTVLGVLDRIDEAVRSGVLLARPRSGACESCELRPVCGTAELERRGHLESTDETVQHCWKALDALRSTP